MAISRKSAAQFALELENAIRDRNTSYDTRVGPIQDLYINPTSVALESQTDSIYQVQQLLSLANDASFTTDDLNKFVYNESMVRLPGSYAKVVLTFARSTPPASSVTIKAGFPVGTMEDEATGVMMTFVVDQDNTFYVDQAVPNSVMKYYNSTTKQYELKVTATATAPGAIGNVGSYRITKPLRALSNFDSVYNESSSYGGRVSETNQELIRRYLNSIVGSSPSVVGGIKKILQTKYPSIADSLIVYGNNPNNVRGAVDGGAVDVYFVGESVATRTETLVYYGPSFNMKLSGQPVIGITGVSILGAVQDTDYSLNKDTGPFAGSVRASDGIVWSVSATNVPNVGSPVSVTYKYNTLPGSLQATFSEADKDVPGRSILFKEAAQVDVELAAYVKVRNSFNENTSKAAVVDAIVSYINSLKLGESLEASDLQAVVRTFTAVDNFVITNMARLNTIGTADIVVRPSEYIRIDASKIAI